MPPKTEAQQTLAMLHRVHESLVHDRTKTAHQMHGFPQRLHEHFKHLDARICELEKQLSHQAHEDDLGQWLMTLPGVGPIAASVLSAEMGDGHQFACTASPRC